MPLRITVGLTAVKVNWMNSGIMNRAWVWKSRMLELNRPQMPYDCKGGKMKKGSNSRDEQKKLKDKSIKKKDTRMHMD